MNAWLPQASYPFGNFSVTSGLTCQGAKGSIGHDFSVCIRTENQNQARFSPFGPQEISVLLERAFGHLRYCLANVPPQPNSPPEGVGGGVTVCTVCVKKNEYNSSSPTTPLVKSHCKWWYFTVEALTSPTYPTPCNTLHHSD